MNFPESVTVSLVLRKIGDESTDDDTWRTLTYALQGAEGVQLMFQIEAGSFGEQDIKDLEVALAEDLAETIVKTVRDAQARTDMVN
jgi:hypothetical protein